MKKTSFLLLMTLLVVFVVLVALLSLCTGVYHLSISEVVNAIVSYVKNGFSASSTAEMVVMNIRMPRIISAIFVGASLATAGAVYQSVFHNPLVSPDLLGVSSGSCIGVALSILLGLGSMFSIVFAFVWGILAVGMAVLVPNIMKIDPPQCWCFPALWSVVFSPLYSVSSNTWPIARIS